MADTFRIRRTHPDPAETEALADVLLDCVEGGASVGFVFPLPRAKALAFWQNALTSAARGERIVLVAEEVESQTIVGTVQVVLAMPDNQPHRADVAKMQVHRRARRRGLGELLLRAAEAEARAAGKTLLVLDTVTGSDAERLYARLGWQRCGTIPGYALWPQGGLCDTTVFYRELVIQTEIATPRQYSLVRFQFDRLPVEYHEKYPFTPEGVYVFFGDIPNMAGHCVVADRLTGRIYAGYHTDNFAEIDGD